MFILVMHAHKPFYVRRSLISVHTSCENFCKERNSPFSSEGEKSDHFFFDWHFQWCYHLHYFCFISLEVHLINLNYNIFDLCINMIVIKVNSFTEWVQYVFDSCQEEVLAYHMDRCCIDCLNRVNNFWV